MSTRGVQPIVHSRHAACATTNNAYFHLRNGVRGNLTSRSKSATRARRRDVLYVSYDEPDSAVSLIGKAMDDIYGNANCTRIKKSLDLTLSGAEVHRQIEGKGEQRASSYIEGLNAIPYHDVYNGNFIWMEILEREHERIQRELEGALANPELATLGNSVWAPAAREEAIAYGPNWRTLVLQDRCQWENVNAQLFPVTTALLKDSKCPSVEVFFARQPPKTGIKPHTDNTNFILTAHLGLDVPERLSWMQVGDFKQYWENGKGLVADTSFIHSTANESAEMDRYVLIVRFWHPELSEVECQALQFLFDALDDPTAYGISAAAQRAKERLPSRLRRRKKKQSSGGGLGLLSKGMH
jgi:hypothetical protein|mmetsp:Transcript_3122/g.11993  ORF Transcript_3122/g.11993 Transcript_3122/m.11993 type:complete len:354 (-) Transcript_3122:1334-2395(-)